MKFLAIIDLAPRANREKVRAELADEIKASWKLFESGVLREAYLTETPTRVVFILEARDAEEAEAELDTLPLVARGEFVVGLMELKPFANWAKLGA